MFAYIWPLVLIVISNIAYQLCAKSLPGEINAFASLIVTYGIGLAGAVVMFFLTSPGDSLGNQLRMMNWAPYVLGLAVLGLEAGYLYAYKAGWAVNVLPIAQSAIVTIGLVVIGYFLYSEGLTMIKFIGIALCIAGLALINLK